jgi:hypothetical protein
VDLRLAVAVLLVAATAINALWWAVIGYPLIGLAFLIGGVVVAIRGLGENDG